MSRRISACGWTMDAELFEDLAVFKIGTPVGIVGIGIFPDLTVSHDLGVGWIDQSQPDRLAVRCPLPGMERKPP